MNMSKVHWWNGIDGGEPKCSEKNLAQYHFVRHRCHMDWPGIDINLNLIQRFQLVPCSEHIPSWLKNPSVFSV